MITLIYFVMACSFVIGIWSTFGIAYISFNYIGGISDVRLSAWILWFITWIIFILCLWQQGYVS